MYTNRVQQYNTSYQLNEPSIIYWIIYLRCYTNTYRVNSTVLYKYIYIYPENIVVFLLINPKQKVYIFSSVRQRLKIQLITIRTTYQCDNRMEITPI